MHKTDEVVITHFFVKSYNPTRTKYKKEASASFLYFCKKAGLERSEYGASLPPP